MKHAIDALLDVLVFHAAPPGRAGLDECAEARSAYEQGDYAAALRLLKPLADGGNAEAHQAAVTGVESFRGV